MLTTLLLHTIEVSEPGQQVFFEVNIPSDAERVIGIETGVLGFACPVDIAGNWIAGDLKIQSAGQANQCFSTEVVLGTSRMEQQILGFPTGPDGQLSALWTAPYSGGVYTEPAGLGLRRCTELHGGYKDIIGAVLLSPLSYTVNLYLWYHRK